MLSAFCDVLNCEHSLRESSVGDKKPYLLSREEML